MCCGWWRVSNHAPHGSQFIWMNAEVVPTESARLDTGRFDVRNVTWSEC